MTLTFIWPLTLTIWRNTFFSKLFILFEVRWRKNVTSYVKIWGSLTEALFCKECFPTNQKFLRLPVPKLWLKRWFSWFLMCLTLTLTSQGHLSFLNSPFVPLHDWCRFWSDIFINSGDIVHWNMEKLPILYNGNFRCHGNVCFHFFANYIGEVQEICVSILRRIGWTLTILEAKFHFS